MPIKNGDTVKVHYTGTLSDGTMFDSSEGRDPLAFTVGSGQVIVGFDSALLGRECGDHFSVTIPAAEAYGPYDEGRVLVGDRKQFPPDAKLERGQVMTIGFEGKGTIEVMVVDANDEEVVVDANHPLAGEDLTFDIKVISINE